MDRPQKGLADYVAIAISPVLIMALVGSLVFFLLEIIYRGQYQASLQYILFCFVFGAVLVSRISMEAGISERAGAYGLVLGLATWLALLRFVEYPKDSPLAMWGWAINIALIAIIWWSAHRLTWDCTFIDDAVDASGVGVLQSAGFEKAAEKREADAKAGPAEASEKKNDEPGLIGWWQRYERFREQRRKQPHTPGVWVVYFSFAALPLFGLGQAQIPPADSARRQYAFQLMCIYVGSGLGLLLTTSFLGLRRYLRQRSLRMPVAITTAWLSLGAVLIILLLGFGAVLPRPADPHPFFKWTAIGSQDRKASAWAKVGGGKEKRPDEKATKTRPSKDNEKDNPEDAGGPKRKSRDQSGDKSGDKSDGQDKAADKSSQDEEKSGDKQDQSDQQKADEEKQKKKNSAAGRDVDKDSKDKGQNAKANKEQPKEKSATERTAATPPPSSGGFVGQMAAFLKWLVIAIVLLLVAFFILRSGLRFLANFTDWARRLLNAFQNWWQGLTALWPRHETADGHSEAVERVAPPRPFSAFTDPFLTGREEQMSPAELVRYSFEALEAWAREHDLGRHDQETPVEFARRLGGEIPPLEKDARHLSGFYATVAYARGKLPGSCRDALRSFWHTLGDVVDHARTLT